MIQDSSHPLSEAADHYEEADQSFIAALAGGVDDATLQTLAAYAVATAKDLERADVAAGPPADGITRYYDAPEILGHCGPTSQRRTRGEAAVIQGEPGSSSSRSLCSSRTCNGH